MKFLNQNNLIFPDNGISACSGVEGSNAQAACMKFFPEGKILFVDSFKAVFEAVDSGKVEFGVLPIENSFNGSVREVYKLVTEYKFFIARSLLLPIRHCLLVNPGVSINDVKQIYSHPQAFGQCSEFLNYLAEKYGTKTIPFWNTAGAAKMISENESKESAAIASPLCSDLYGLGCLASDIQDNNHNYTKFICVHKEPVIYSGSNHISLIIGCENKPGALNAVLSKISEHGVNMNKLESCPKSGTQFEYIFFLELEANANDSGIASMLSDIEKSCSEFIFLGSYKLI